MGDSDGAARTFEHVNDDLRKAIDHFFARCPQLQEVVLWGLCDGASASMFYAGTDERVTGMVLLNPWVRTVQGAARTVLRHYYAKRLLETGFWHKLLHGRFDFRAAARDVARTTSSSMMANASDASLPDRMLRGLNRFKGNVLFIISGNDLTAQEFVNLTGAQP